MATRGKLYNSEEATVIILQGLYDNEASSSDSEMSAEEEEEAEDEMREDMTFQEVVAFDGASNSSQQPAPLPEFADFSENEDLYNNVSDPTIS